MADSQKPLHNFSFHYVNTTQVTALSASLLAIGTTVVALRFWTRRLQNMKLGIDDWLIVSGLLFLIGMGACMIAGAHKGYFGAPTPPPPSNLTPLEQELYIEPSTLYLEIVEYPFQILMILAYGCIKLSIIAFYRRLFVVVKWELFDWVTLISGVITFLWTLTFLLIIIFGCGTHISANWGSFIANHDHCHIGTNSEYALSISDFIVDISIFLLPMPIIWNLQLSIRKKIAVSGVLLLAASAVGASLARMILYVKLLNALKTGAVIVDPNQEITVALWYSLLETGLALIAACLPTLSFLFTHAKLKATLSSIRSFLSSSSSPSANSATRPSAKSGASGPGKREDILLNPYVDLEATKSAGRSTFEEDETERASHSR